MRLVAAHIGGTAGRRVIGCGITADQAHVEFGTDRAVLSPAQRQATLN